MDGAGKPRWSIGREDTRAIFRDGQCMGRMNETETAAVVVRVMNGQGATVLGEQLAALKRSMRAALSAADGRSYNPVAVALADILDREDEDL